MWKMDKQQPYRPKTLKQLLGNHANHICPYYIGSQILLYTIHGISHKTYFVLTYTHTPIIPYALETTKTHEAPPLLGGF
jgi:hypothetical protein